MNHNVSKKKRQDRQMEEKERGRSGPTGLNDRGERQKKISWGEGKCENAEIKITRRNPIPSAKTDVYSE